MEEDMKLSMDYDFMNDVFHVVYNNQGVEMHKVLSINTVSEFFSEFSANSLCYQLGRFPAGYVCGNRKGNGDATIAFTKEAFRGVLTYLIKATSKEVVFDEFPFPNLLFVADIGYNQYLKKAYAYAFFGELTADTVLYRLPIGNIYNDCSICMGANSVMMDAKNDYRALERFMRLFYSSSFNDDLYRSPLPQIELLQKVANEGFSPEMLEEVGPVVNVLRSRHQLEF